MERCLPRETPRAELTQQQKADRVKAILEKHTRLTTYAEWILAERIKHSEATTPNEGIPETAEPLDPPMVRELSSRLGSSPKEEEVWATDCAVCLSEFEKSEPVRELPCDHIFHDECIQSWFAKAKTAACPLCRNLLHSGLSEEQIGANTSTLSPTNAEVPPPTQTSIARDGLEVV